MKVVRWDESAHVFAAEKMQKVGLFQGDGFFMDLYCLEPGQMQKPHAHDDANKIYLVVEGCGRFRVGDEERTLKAGEAVLSSPGDVHGIENDSGARLVVLTAMMEDQKLP